MFKYYKFVTVISNLVYVESNYYLVPLYEIVTKKI